MKCIGPEITQSMIAVVIMLSTVAFPAHAQGIKKETLTEDPAVVESLEPPSSPEGTRSPKVLDADQDADQNDVNEALDQAKRTATDVEGRPVEKQTREGGDSTPEEPGNGPEKRARVPDANEPHEQRK